MTEEQFRNAVLTQLKFQQGIIIGVREAIIAKLDRIERLIVEHHGHNAPPLTLSGAADADADG